MKPQIAQGFLLLGIVNAVPIAFDWDSSVKYTGVYQSSIEIFLGIPYGQDTGGANRFKPPRPYIPIRGTTINATAAGPACPQALGANFYLGDITSTSEDCLHLNIARPNGTSSQAKLPVMVHIHGGSFVTGSKDVTAIQPGGLILQAVANGLPVIEVNLNYRLGVFGFAKSQALIDDHSANAGLRDQRLALEWIQNNIEYFGGDCEKITVFGQSSGGLAVGMQIMAYGGEKPVPFHQAICESQALEPGITGKYTDLAMQRVIDAAGCNTTSLQSEATISCLRNLTTEQLFDAQSITYLSSGSAANIGDEWLPTVDGDFVPAAPSLLIEQRKFANVDTIIGWCQDDATLFTPPNITSADDTRTFIQDYVTAMTAESLDDLLSLYPVTDFQASPSDNKTVEFYRAARIVRDILFVCQPIYYAEAISAASNKVYLYEQNQTLLTPLEDAEGNPGLGVVSGGFLYGCTQI